MLLKHALISPCGTFRYTLVRVWDDTKPRLLFVMLNPSTADASVDDATIRKCVGFATRMGFGGITVVNLFAYRATKPSDLIKAKFPEGPGNQTFLLEALHTHSDVVFAWGAIARRAPNVTARVEGMAAGAGCKVHVLRRLADGTPEHPLYVPYPLAA